MEYIYPTSFTYTEALLFFFVLACIIHLHYILRYYRPLAKYKKKEKAEHKNKGVSVIIAAKNELENLKQNLSHVLCQDYPEFEVIVIDDHSNDSSLEYLSGFKEEQLRVIRAEIDEHGKKRALAKGVQNAKYDWLLFTDADCKPASTHWLSQMAERLSDHQMVLGHGRFYKTDGFLNQLIRYECFQNAMQYMAFALAGRPYMGVGRNLAVHKNVFLSAQLNLLAKIKSGDDDLLVNEMGRYVETGIVTEPQAHTLSHAETSWKAYFFQKRRQLQAGNYYQFKDQFKLTLIWAAQFYSWWLFIALMLLGEYRMLILVLFFIKQMIQLISSRALSKQLRDHDLWKMWPFLEFVFLHWHAYTVVSIWFRKVDRWK
ncbi:MAG: glycosyltransferase [Vicingaceae bacterium]